MNANIDEACNELAKWRDKNDIKRCEEHILRLLQTLKENKEAIIKEAEEAEENKQEAEEPEAEEPEAEEPEAEKPEAEKPEAEAEEGSYLAQHEDS